MNQLAMEQSNIADLPSLSAEPPSKAIADIPRIGGVDAGVDNTDQIGAAKSDVLADKLEVYRTEGANLAAHHEYMLERFNTLFTDYVSMFSTLDVLASLNDSIKAVLPNFQLQEEFSFFSLEGEHAELAAKFSQYAFWGGVVVGGVGGAGGLISAYGTWKSTKAQFHNYSNKTLHRFKANTIPPNKLAKMTKLGRARVLKGFGLAGAVLGVVGAGMGIYGSIQNEIARRDFLEKSVFSFQNWYDETRASYDALEGGVMTMEEALREMMALLGITTIDDPDAITDENIDLLIIKLQEASAETGKHEAKVKTAARIFCRDDTTAAGTVANLTGLKLLKAADIQTQIQGTEGVKICAIVEA